MPTAAQRNRGSHPGRPLVTSPTVGGALLEGDTMTARWWMWWNEGWVRLSLRPGQELRFGLWVSTDEGFAAEYWHYEHDGDQLVAHVVDDGRDCDGRLTRCNTYHCPLTDLQRNPAFDRPDSAENDGIYLPDWRRGDSSQCDEYAEAAGY